MSKRDPKKSGAKRVKALTDEILIDLVVKQRKTDKEIAKLFGISKSAVTKRRDTLSLKRKSNYLKVIELINKQTLEKGHTDFLVDQENMRRFNKYLTDSLTLAEAMNEDDAKAIIYLEHIAKSFDVDGHVLYDNPDDLEALKGDIETYFKMYTGTSIKDRMDYRMNVIRSCLPAIKHFEEYVERLTKAESIAIMLQIIKEQIGIVAPEARDEIGRRLHAFLRFGTNNKPIELIEQEKQAKINEEQKGDIKR